MHETGRRNDRPDGSDGVVIGGKNAGSDCNHYYKKGTRIVHKSVMWPTCKTHYRLDLRNSTHFCGILRDALCILFLPTEQPDRE